MTNDPTPQVPDPNGPPVLSYFGKKAQRAFPVGTMMFIGGAGALIAIALVSTPTMGAVRSSRITWQVRQQEIAEAQSQAAIDEAASQDATLPNNQINQVPLTPEQTHE